VIGEPLDATKFSGVLDTLHADATGDFWFEAAKAIMTTDTYPKVATRSAEIGGVKVSINGIAKGAGMIAPDMATMLSFVVTDADIAPAALQAMLSAGVDPTFNSMTVDSDTSTSDTLMLFATGAAAEDGQLRVEAADDPRLGSFRAALNDLLGDLALQVVRDGEGATKMLEITVTGAESDAAARKLHSRSPIRRWSRPRQPARTPTGAVSSWLSANLAKWPTAIASPSGSAMCALPSTASVTPAIRSRLPPT
jgi:glutamate N-acetyltransferase/amino-acid N-acetyltransferase